MSRGALEFLARQSKLPAGVADLITNGGQFATTPKDVPDALVAFDLMLQSQHVFGDARASDVDDILAIVVSQPACGRARSVRTRQRRLLERIGAFLARRFSTTHRRTESAA